MDENGERHNSIVNGRHMKDVQRKLDSEYKARLRYQEQVRENSERLREKRASSQRTPNPLNISSTQRYSRPWQKGMSTRTEVSDRKLRHEEVTVIYTGNEPECDRQPVKRPAVAGVEGRQTPRQPYKGRGSKPPAIRKDEDVISLEASHSCSPAHPTHRAIPASQPRISVEKKRLHDHPPSARPRVTRVTGETARKNMTPQLQSTDKESKRPAKHQKELSKGKATSNGPINALTSTHQPRVEQETVLRYDADHHDPPTSPPLLNSHELTEESQTTGRPLTFNRSHLPEPEEDVLNGQPQRTVNEGEDDLSYVSDTLMLPVSRRTGIYNTSLLTGGSDSTDSAEEDTIDGDIEEHSCGHTEDEEVNLEISHSTLQDLDFGTGNGSYYERTNREPVRTSEPTVTDRSPNSNPDLRDTVEVPRIDASIAPSRNHEIGADLENRALPQTTLREPEGNETDRPRQLSGGPSPPAPPRVSTAPNIALLRENLDLVLHTLSMQRQSERRNVENTVPTSQNNEADKQKTDPEKLKKLQESLLQEESEEEEDVCRICLAGGEAEDNRLIAPCRCAGSLRHVHSQCMRRWLLAKIKSGAELNTVMTCEMCKQKVECEIEGFNVMEHYRKHQETQATLNPSLYLALLLHLYQQRYEELLQLSHTRDRVSEISRRFLHLSFGRHEQPRDNEQQDS